MHHTEQFLGVYFTQYFLHRFSGLKLRSSTDDTKGAIREVPDILHWQLKTHADSSALVQFDLYEQLNQSAETIIVMLAKNISAYFYALT